MRNFMYILAGTGIFLLAQSISDIFLLYRIPDTGGAATTFVTNHGELFNTGQKIDAAIMTIIRFLRYLLAGIAVFYIVRSGISILFVAEKETVDKEKDTFLYGFIGFLIIMVSQPLIQSLYSVAYVVKDQSAIGEYIAQPSVDIPSGVKLITNITNLFLVAMGSLALFILVAAGVMYAMSAGNEERSKKAGQMIIGSVMGLVMAFSAYTIVAEFAAGGQSLELKTKQVPDKVMPFSLNELDKQRKKSTSQPLSP